MKVQATYKGKTVEIDIPDEKLEELVKEQKKTGWEKPENKTPYWAVDSANDVWETLWYGEQEDDAQYRCGNCFTSKTLAENIARYQSLDLRIRRRIAEICEPLDWNNSYQSKYYFYYDHAYHRFYFDEYRATHTNTWYCDTREHAEQIVEEFKDDLIWYFTEFKDRMDG